MGNVKKGMSNRKDALRAAGLVTGATHPGPTWGLWSSFAGHARPALCFPWLLDPLPRGQTECECTLLLLLLLLLLLHGLQEMTPMLAFASFLCFHA